MQAEIIKVDPNTETICCDGGEDSLGHPAVYYSFDLTNKITCGYCGKHTHEVDYDYLSGTDHLGCVLEKENNKENQIELEL